MKPVYEQRLRIVEEYFDKVGFDSDLLEYYTDKNVLVTGGAGAIGSNLIIMLSKLVGPHGKVVILDNLSSSKTESNWNITPLTNVMFVKGDVRSDVDMKRVFKEDIDIVFHLAAFFANQNSVDYPEISAEVDVIGQIKLLEYSRLASVSRFVYASSGCAVYGSSAQLPVKEDFISMHLTTPYQVNKMTGEMYCNFYHHNYGLNTVNCRFFNSYGPGEIPGQYRNVIPNFIYWAMKKKPLPITGDGSETRDFTYVLDLVQGLIKSGFYNDAIGENFNLSAGREISIADMAKAVNIAASNEDNIEFKPRRTWDTKKRMLACTDKAERLIGYKPMITFEEGFKENVQWFKDNWELIENDADFTPGMSSAVR
ncbi:MULTISPECIES: NAD-dependent epimerase/dehydratase family protein [Vibrio]|jgi:nucleoside-diphosphate-sugar epimerase|uniref:NAD-dependent epimerase/dehydratase family protein n=3 Tax=Vibrionaceae TaxID=641 RepID=UPI0002F28060|nr:NAD-dependent epimerase/dehydratase family protein [Vibrio tasmaniensis]